MKTNHAYFSDIGETIVQQLDGARGHVSVAVAWITDRTLFYSLISCLQRGVAVSVVILDHRSNRNSSIPWDQFTALGGLLWWLPDEAAGSLHHKFCIVDDSTVITGSFNWTNRARRAHENIIVIEGDAAIVEQYRQEIAQVLAEYGHPQERFRSFCLKRPNRNQRPDITYTDSFGTLSEN